MSQNRPYKWDVYPSKYEHILLLKVYDSEGTYIHDLLLAKEMIKYFEEDDGSFTLEDYVFRKANKKDDINSIYEMIGESIKCAHECDEGFNNVSKCKKCGKYSA